MIVQANGPLQLFPLLRVVVFLIGGIVAGDLFDSPYRVWFALIGLGLGTVVFLSGRVSSLFSGVALCFSVFCLGLFLYHLKRIDVTEYRYDVPTTYKALVMNKPQEVGDVVRCRLLVTHCEGEKVKQPYEVNASFLKEEASNDWQQLKQGSGIEARSVLKMVSDNVATSHFSYRRWAEANDIRGNTFIYHTAWWAAGTNEQYAELPLVWKLRLRMQLMQQQFSGMLSDAMGEERDSRLLKTVVLGDKSGLSVADKNTFSVAGVSHVLALSGLHLGIIYAFLSVLLTQLFRPFRYCFLHAVLLRLFLLFTIWAYVFLVGMSSSVVRAAIMLSVYSVVSLLSQEKTSLNTLAFTGMVMLLINPLLVWDVSFQLSFVAVLSIFVFYPFIYSLVAHRTTFKPLLWFWALVSVSLSAQLGTAPLVAYYFGRFSNYFLLSNLLVVPLITCVIYLSVTLLLFRLAGWMISVMADVLSFLSEAIFSIVNMVASLPGASVEEIDISVFQVVLLYMSIGCGYLLCRYVRKMVHLRRQFKNS